MFPETVDMSVLVSSSYLRQSSLLLLMFKWIHEEGLCHVLAELIKLLLLDFILTWLRTFIFDNVLSLEKKTISRQHISFSAKKAFNFKILEYRKVKKLSEYFLQIKLMNTIFIQKLPEFISEHPLKRYLSTSLEN